MAATSSHVDLEDTVEYWLFPNISEDVNELEQLETFRTKCFTFLLDRSKSYIWHDESINLTVVPQRTSQHAGKYSISSCLFLLQS